MLFSCYLQIFHSFIGHLRCFVANLLVLIFLGLFCICAILIAFSISAWSVWSSRQVCPPRKVSVSLEGLVTQVDLVSPAGSVHPGSGSGHHGGSRHSGNPGLSDHPCMSGHPGLSGGSGPISTLDQSRNQSSSSSVLMPQVDQDVHQINGKDSEGVFTRVGHADVSADSDAECEKSLVEMEF